MSIINPEILKMYLSTNVGNLELAEQYIRVISDFEKDRIIKLLEGYQGLTGMFALERDDLIALIKGETK